MNELTAEKFVNPEALDKGAPFWCWNGALEYDELLSQIETFCKMHMGGAHIHARVGLEDEYLGDEFMRKIKFCADEFKKRGMLAWLYDEDRYPSGYAGGLVTRERRFRAQFVTFTPEKLPDDVLAHSLEELFSDDTKTSMLLSAYSVKLQNGFLESYKLIADTDSDSEDGEIWHLYLRLQKPSSWFNNQSYANTMDSATVDRFIETTYEAYKKVLGDEFGKSVPAIFTDEPQMQRKGFLSFSNSKEPVNLPFTYDMLKTYREAYGEDFLNSVPELIWNLPEGKPSAARWRYHDHTAERFVSAYVDRIGAWCEKNNIKFTGHMNSEQDLYSQTSSIGDAMRCYRSFQQPGIDILADHREYVTAKQAVSVARQRGISRVTSELYGVTNWDFPFSGYKLQGDWQAALGVTTRVHHLTLYSMAGESKRDYPASIGAHIPWHEKFALLEDHYSRLNTVLTRGKPVVKVGVIHPIETYWLIWGPRDTNMTERAGREADLKNIVEALIFANIDFDFISESLLPDQCREEAGFPFEVGQMKYEAVVVPGNLTIRSSTLNRLKSFKKAGGTVIWAGESPRCVDAFPDERAPEFADLCTRVPITRSAISRELDGFRDIEIRNADGSLTDHLLYQLREDGADKWLYICHVLKKRESWSPYLTPYLNRLSNPDKVKLKLHGEYSLELFDTLTGDILPYESKASDGITCVDIEFFAHDSVLFRLRPKNTGESGARSDISEKKQLLRLDTRFESAGFRLHEENCLLLDMAEFRIDCGEWRDKEEVLKIDEKIRSELGFDQRVDTMAQPYAVQTPDIRNHILKLKFTFASDIDVKGAFLAVEQPEYAEICFDGQKVSGETAGYFVDRAIKKLALPDFEKGFHTIDLTIRYGERSNIEWCYLLGDFGVDVIGTQVKITSLPAQLVFDDITRQRLAFYGGNIDYELHFYAANDGRYRLRVPNFYATVLGVSVDNADRGIIAYAPYEADLGVLKKGRHRITITMFGNRINTFGQLHMKDDDLTFFGPDAWRTSGDRYTYEYRLKPQGIISSPVLFLYV